MKAQNKSGTWFKLVSNKEGDRGLVYKLCSNYNGRVRGGISKQWRCVQPKSRMSHNDFQKMAREGMPMVEAKSLFNRRLKGTQK